MATVAPGHGEAPPFDAPPPVLAKVQELEGAIEQKPTARALYLQLAQLYVDAKRKDLAAATLERGLALDPTSTYLKHRLAQVKGEAPAVAGAAAAAPAVRRAATVAFQPVVRPQAPPVKNQLRGPTPKQKLAVAAAVVAVGLAIGLKMWLFPGTRVLVAGNFRAYAPVWSPTGRHLAFLIGEDAATSLAVYDFAKADFRRIAPTSAWEAQAFSWSPDGKKLAYASPAEAGEWQDAVFVVDADGGQPKKVAAGTSPTWAADGQTLIMVCSPERPSFPEGDSEEGGGGAAFSQQDWGPRYCRVNVHTGDAQRTALEPQYGAALSPLHEAVVYEQAQEGATAETAGTAPVSLDGEFQQLADNVAAGRARNVAEGTRDLTRELEAKQYAQRRQAAMTAEHLPYAADVYVAGLSSGAPTAVTSDRKSAFPSWTADGDRIVFATDGPSGLEFCTIRPDGTERRTVLSGVKGVDPYTVTLSPNGRDVFFVATVPGEEGMARIMTGEMPADLHVASIGSNDVKRLANTHAFKRRFAVSPDGKRIVYEVLQDVKLVAGASKSELWLMRR